ITIVPNYTDQFPQPQVLPIPHSPFPISGHSPMSRPASPIRVTRWIAAFWTSICLISVATASPGRSPQEVLAEVRAATGGQRWDAVKQIEAQGQFAVGGLSGRFESIESLVDERRVSKFDLGVLAGSQGFDGTAPWNADAAGLIDVVEDEVALQRAATEGFLTSRAYLRSDASFGQANVRTERDSSGQLYEVVTITPNKGDPVELWVSEESKLIARVVRPQLREITELSDYRVGDGLRLLHRIQTTDSSNNPQTYTIESYRVGKKLDESKLRRPRSAARDVQISAAGVMPAFVESGHVFIEASVGDN